MNFDLPYVTIKGSNCQRFRGAEYKRGIEIAYPARYNPAMNLILLEPNDLTGDDMARISGRRLDHARKVFRAKTGEELAVGLLNGNRGKGTVTAITGEYLDLTLRLDEPPPPPLPVTLILALPRPKMLNRVLQAATSMGVKKIYLINSWRVEKSYWESPKLGTENMREQMILGLEQAKDTLLPEVHLKRLFAPFVREELPTLIKGTRPLLAHPSAVAPFPKGSECHLTLAVGPEGGFIEREVETFKEVGFQPVSLGERILRVETAVPALLARLG